MAGQCGETSTLTRSMNFVKLEKKSNASDTNGEVPTAHPPSRTNLHPEYQSGALLPTTTVGKEVPPVTTQVVLKNSGVTTSSHKTRFLHSLS